MTTAPTPPALAALLGTLRDLMAAERRAIARLDVAALEALTATKRDLAAALAAASAATPRPDPALARLIAHTRVELGANGALIAAATEAVAAALGQEPAMRYDRAARALVTTRPLRVVAY